VQAAIGGLTTRFSRNAARLWQVNRVKAKGDVHANAATMLMGTSIR
jgi:hypothetical protein